MSSVDFLTLGRGPGLVVIPGSTRRARHYRALAETIPDPKLVVTPEMDHNAPDLEASAEVARLIRA